MKRLFTLSVLSLSLLLLAACGGSTAPQVAAPVVDAPQVAAPEVKASAVALDEAAAGEPAGSAPIETLVDEQGAVAVAVTPLSVETGVARLDFEVAMNTHSVDLSMDLAQLATLTSDAGVEVAASGWDGQSGGHHVSGKLSFPAEKDGVSLLDGATTITLLLRDVDSPARTFTWTLQ